MLQEMYMRVEKSSQHRLGRVLSHLRYKSAVVYSVYERAVRAVPHWVEKAQPALVSTLLSDCAPVHAAAASA
jgi:hypothetical protein